MLRFDVCCVFCAIMKAEDVILCQRFVLAPFQAIGIVNKCVFSVAVGDGLHVLPLVPIISHSHLIKSALFIWFYGGKYTLSRECHYANQLLGTYQAG